MPRYSTAMRSYSPSTAGVTSELGIVWSSSGGHTHDGVESSIIDGEAYSMFDFRPASRTSTIERDNIQTRNRLALRQFIADTIRQDYNITIDPDTIGAANIIGGSITGNNIAANTITTDLLATDAITSLNYSYSSGNYSSAGTFFDLSDGSIISKQFYIDNSGNAGFKGSISLGTYNYWNSDGTFSVGNSSESLVWNGSSLSLTGDISLGSYNYWLNGGDFRVGGSSEYLLWDQLAARVRIRGDIELGTYNYWTYGGDFRVGGSSEYMLWDQSASTLTIKGDVVLDSDNYWYRGGDFRIGTSNKYIFWDQSASTLNIRGNIYAEDGTFTGNITSTATISGGVISLNSDKLRLDPSISFNDGTASGTVAALRIHNNTSSLTVSAIANGIYFQDPNTASVFSKIAGNTWLGNARLDIVGPKNSYGNPSIQVGQDGIYANYPKSISSPYESFIGLSSTAAIGISNGAFFQAYDTYARINKTLYLSSTGNNILYNPNSTSSGKGYIRIGNDDANSTPITINTTHAGLSGIRYMISFYHNDGNVGSISHDGTNTTYSTSSDYRLKENVETIYDGLEKVKQIKPRYYDFIGNSEAGRQAGFIAHELQEAVPQAAFGEKDAVDENGEPVLQQIEKAAIVPYLVAAIQELSNEIDELKAQIASFSN